MRVAQDLYEGIEIGDEGAVGLITYMRTDSTRVAESAAHAGARVSAHAVRRGVRRARRRSSTATARSKNTQDAHEGVRPTDPTRRPDDGEAATSRPTSSSSISSIWQRFMASQMAPAVFDTTTVDFDIPSTAQPDIGRRSYLFRATGSDREVPGLPRAVSRSARGGRAQGARGRAGAAGRRGRREGAVQGRSRRAQHFTEPPPRFSEASLVKELERLGIGRPSTYASIISVLADRRYVELEQRRFFPTELGETVEKVMVKQFPDIFNVGLHVGDGRGARQGRGGRPRLAEGAQGLLLAVRRAPQQGRRAGADRRGVRSLADRRRCAVPTAAASSSRAADSSGRSSPARIIRRRASTRGRSRARRRSR